MRERLTNQECQICNVAFVQVEYFLHAGFALNTASTRSLRPLQSRVASRGVTPLMKMTKLVSFPHLSALNMPSLSMQMIYHILYGLLGEVAVIFF